MDHHESAERIDYWRLGWRLLLAVVILLAMLAAAFAAGQNLAAVLRTS